MVERLEPQKLTIVYNEAAGKTRGILRDCHHERRVESFAKRVQGYGWWVDTYRTKGPGDATDFAASSGENGIDDLVGWGGDGVRNEIGRGILSKKSNSEVALTGFPKGTVNVLPKEFGIPNDPIRAADALVHGMVRRMDVGMISDGISYRRPFLLMAGVGIDGEVMGRVQKPGEAKTRKGKWPYFEELVKISPFFRGVSGEYTIDGVKRAIKFIQVWFQNTQNLGGYGTIREDGRSNDKEGEISFFEGETILNGVRILAALYTPWGISQRFQGQDFWLDLERPVAAEIDGEPLERSKHFEMEVVPAAINVLTPDEKIVLFEAAV